MEAILVAISPVIVTGLTSGLKRLTGIHLNENHKAAVRTLAAVLSLVVAALVAVSTGAPIDQQVVEIAVFSVLNFVGSTGVWFLAKTAGKSGV